MIAAANDVAVRAENLQLLRLEHDVPIGAGEERQSRAILALDVAQVSAEPVGDLRLGEIEALQARDAR